jgi:neutral ceramidase
VQKAFTHLEPIATTTVRAVSSLLELPVPTVTEEQITAMRKVMAQPPQPGVDFTLDRVLAVKTLALASLGGKLAAEIQVLAVGPIAFVAIPGELFVELGQAIQKASPFKYTVIVEQANDTIGYLPNREAFEQGGYEPTAARIAPGGGEKIVAKAIELLNTLGVPAP